MNDYKKSLDSLHYSDIQKQRIAHAAVYAVENKQPANPKTHRSAIRVALAAACISVLLITGVAAAGGLKNVTDVFGPIFGVREAQTEIIDNIGRPIGAGDTEDGITITADAVIGDKFNACIVYTISREDGSPVLPEGVTINQLFCLYGGADINAGFGGTHGTRGFLDFDPNDSAVQYVQYVSADEPLKPGVVPVEFSKLAYRDSKNNEQIISNGTWKFSFDFDYEDCSLSLTTDESFSQYGMTYSITEVTVSPIAVRVTYEVDHEIAWSNAPDGKLPESDASQMRRYFENVSIILYKTDGTEIDMTNAGGSINPENGKTYCIKGELLPEIVPMDELEYISIGGIKLTINN